MVDSRQLPGRRLLSVIGAINWDIGIFEERFARPGEEVPVRNVEEFSGGKGANAAVASARVLGKGKVALIGALGDDEIESRQLAELAAEGVVLDGVTEIGRCRSGRAYILIDALGHKTIHTHFGANARLTPLHLQEKRCAGVIGKTDVMVVMDPPTRVALAAAQAASENGAKLIYSPGVRTQEGVRALEEIVKITDFLVVDRIELMNLHEADDEQEALKVVSEKHPRTTVVATLGPGGCIVARDGLLTRVPGVDVSSLGKKVVNTTGCGDAFLGVFASYLYAGCSPTESAVWANLAGALKATRFETRGSPTRKDLEVRMRQLGRVNPNPFGVREEESG